MHSNACHATLHGVERRWTRALRAAWSGTGLPSGPGGSGPNKSAGTSHMGDSQRSPGQSRTASAKRSSAAEKSRPKLSTQIDVIDPDSLSRVRGRIGADPKPYDFFPVPRGEGAVAEAHGSGPHVRHSLNWLKADYGMPSFIKEPPIFFAGAALNVLGHAPKGVAKLTRGS